MSEVDLIKIKVGMNNDWDASYTLINKPEINYETVRIIFKNIFRRLNQ